MTGRIWVKAQEPVPTVHVNMEIYQTGRYKEAASVENLSGDQPGRDAATATILPFLTAMSAVVESVARPPTTVPPFTSKSTFTICHLDLQGPRSREGSIAVIIAAPVPWARGRSARIGAGHLEVSLSSHGRMRNTVVEEHRTANNEAELPIVIYEVGLRFQHQGPPAEPRHGHTHQTRDRPLPRCSRFVQTRPICDRRPPARHGGRRRLPHHPPARNGALSGPVAPVEVRVGDVLFDDKDVNSQTKEGIQSLRRQLRPSLNRGQDHVYGSPLRVDTGERSLSRSSAVRPAAPPQPIAYPLSRVSRRPEADRSIPPTLTPATCPPVPTVKMVAFSDNLSSHALRGTLLLLAGRVVPSS